MAKKKKFYPTVHLDEDSLNIFTDGSCSRGGLGDGGVGVVFLTLNEDGTDWYTESIPLPGYKNARIGQMEIQACILALNEAQRRSNFEAYSKIEIYTDSQYVCDEFRRLRYRKQNKWLNADGAPVENAPLLKELLKITENLKPISVLIHHVKGHSKDPYNKLADRAAKSSRKYHLQAPLEPSRVARKRTAEFTSPGSIEMKGQTLEIRILETRWLKIQKLNKYRFEVLSGPDQGANSFIYAEPEIEVLKRNQLCTVRVNSETRNPRVVEVIS